MAYNVQILCDSVNPAGGRLTTFECTYPRFVHSELMTHRAFSRNAASSRAIPIGKMIERVLEDPAMPVQWGKNQPGMQAEAELVGAEQAMARGMWLDARDEAVDTARRMHALGVHKQIVNRLLEPWMWITVLISATEFQNFFALRCHPAAQPEIRRFAEMMQALYREQAPRALAVGAWHLPLIGFPLDECLTLADQIRVCVGRCARISYLTHHGERDVGADLELHDRLEESGHFSPFEHAAVALNGRRRSGNFWGFEQYRQMLPGQNEGPR